MPILRAILPCLIAIVFSAASARAEEPAGKTVFEQGDGIFTRCAPGGAVEKISDSAHCEKIDRDGDHVYVLMCRDDHRVWLEVIECDATGAIRKTRKIADDRLSPITAIVSAAFLPDGRLFVETHVNPSLSVGVAVDLNTGNTLFLPGYGFTWNRTGRHIAYLVDAPRGTPPGTPTEVWLDGKRLRDVPAGDAGLSWDAAGTRLTITFAQNPKTDGIVVIEVNDDASVATSN